MVDPGQRILIVEDEESLADSVRYNLEREGYAVSIAMDGRKALERFRKEPPALVILDLMLPEVSGLDVCRAIRAESLVPIIMVTAKDSEADKVAGLELGADDYVTKPFSVRELVSRVRAHLRRAVDVARGGDGRHAHRRTRSRWMSCATRSEWRGRWLRSRPRSSSSWRRS